MRAAPSPPLRVRPTVRQLEVLRAIASLSRTVEVGPTLKELAAEIEVTSLNAVHVHKRLLTKKALVTFDGTARGLTLTALGRRFLK